MLCTLKDEWEFNRLGRFRGSRGTGRVVREMAAVGEDANVQGRGVGACTGSA